MNNSTPSKFGVLLMNLGSPDSPSVPDVRRYLREFLMDGRVIDTPWPIRFALVNGLILVTRPKDAAHAYSTIWTSEGSPLVATSRRVKTLLEEKLDCPVELCMRYQNPPPLQALRSLHEQGVTEVFLIPLFPHYAMSSFESAVERVRVVIKEFPQMKLRVMPAYYNHPDYIDALVKSAQPYLEQEHDLLLFSFHGIPERHLCKSDPTKAHCFKVPNCCDVPSPAHATCYRHQCFETVRLFVDKAGLTRDQYAVSFQSRLGRDPWLKPYTDLELPRFAQEGKKRVLVICPAFVSDCLETIEEIGIRGEQTFTEAGGTSLSLIPCMNEHPRWIQALATFVESNR